MLGEWVSERELDCQFWFFQEVSAFKALNWCSLPGDLMCLVNDYEGPWNGLRVIGRSDMESHLGQMIAVEDDVLSHVIDTKATARCILVQVQLNLYPTQLCMISCHLPHKDNTAQALSDAVTELECLLRAHRGCPTVTAGDFNAQLGDDRFLQLSTMMHSMSFICRQSGLPTRHGKYSHREYDFFFDNLATTLQLRSDDVEVTVGGESSQGIRSDHDLVRGLFPLPAPAQQQQESAAGLSTKSFKAAGVAKWEVNAEALHAQVESLQEPPGSVEAQWEWFKTHPPKSLPDKRAANTVIHLTSRSSVGKDELAPMHERGPIS